ncbi:MAG TPA: cyclopropane-fatty-acyl-phospholipid synthase family protein [Rhizomicrobium sp.]|nr:cyclopropane-fatty-acyl-phospholipid synthase family protein [Rhizomicrobium sp.]
MLASVLLSLCLESVVRKGHLRMIDASGAAHDFGEADRPALTIRLHDRDVERSLLLDPQMALGESYTDGRLTVEDGDIADLLELLTANLGLGFGSAHWRAQALLRRLARGLAQFNTRPRSKNNVARHYDLSAALYDLFLDSERQYSCAFFETPADSLETAQRNKMRRIAAKLDLKPGQRVLDIGCGWGGLSLYLAQTADVAVTGITLSEEQLKIAKARARACGMAGRVRFELRDYRDVDGQFDRIVSVGMFEHVGVPHYARYFNTVAELLTADGVALIHSIGRSDGAGATNPWIAKYIFPGGYTPALSEVLPSVERSGLYVTDVEILRLHYAMTLSAWRKRFLAHRDRARDLYDERFCRMWEFYLAGAEMGFRHQGLMVFQLQLARNIGTLPLTRDYMSPARDGLELEYRAA